MNATHCPICYTELLSKAVTPCMDCGCLDAELDHFQEHSYSEYAFYYGERIVLCDFCAVDFGSYNPAYFGFPSESRISLEDLQFVKEIKGHELRMDKYCPECNHRLPFLAFVDRCRRKNQ